MDLRHWSANVQKWCIEKFGYLFIMWAMWRHVRCSCRFCLFCTVIWTVIWGSETMQQYKFKSSQAWWSKQWWCAEVLQVLNLSKFSQLQGFRQLMLFSCYMTKRCFPLLWKWTLISWPDQLSQSLHQKLEALQTYNMHHWENIWWEASLRRSAHRWHPIQHHILAQAEAYFLWETFLCLI